MQAYVVVYNNEDEIERDGSVHATLDEAMVAGEEMARAKWAELIGEPFPPVEDAWEAMDKLRVKLDVTLEVESFYISRETARALANGDGV